MICASFSPLNQKSPNLKSLIFSTKNISLSLSLSLFLHPCISLNDNIDQSFVAINPNPKNVHPLNPLIDTRRPFSSSAITSSSAAKPSNHLSITELNGIVHLIRCQSPSSTTSLTSPSAQSTKLFVVAVPNYLSPDDFLLFCGSHLDHFSELNSG
ncbi:unnamed protein product [Camellia sinensis]